jgi:hypothetical protein
VPFFDEEMSPFHLRYFQYSFRFAPMVVIMTSSFGNRVNERDGIFEQCRKQTSKTVGGGLKLCSYVSSYSMETHTLCYNILPQLSFWIDTESSRSLLRLDKGL